MADCIPERIMSLWNTCKWLKWDYIPVLNVHLITDSLLGITQVLYFKENKF